MFHYGIGTTGPAGVYTSARMSESIGCQGRREEVFRHSPLFNDTKQIARIKESTQHKMAIKNRK